MPIVMLNDDIYALPNPLLSEDGLVAVGGDLHPERLIHAYKHGIFPWYGQEGPILWHAPDPRYVITKDHFHLPKSAREFIAKSHGLSVLTHPLIRSFNTAPLFLEKGKKELGSILK